MSIRDQALAFAAVCHQGVYRKYTGDDYITHPIRVAATLSDMGFDDEVVAAAYLHDVVEDCGVTAADLNRRFGERVTRLVLEVTDVSRPADGNRRVRKAIDRDHLAQASADGQSIKLADLLDNLVDVVQHDRAFGKVFVGEAVDLHDVLIRGHPDLRQRLSIVLATAVTACSR
jgi:(p)ppGpp synthase/HD superfamily hydrolase